MSESGPKDFSTRRMIRRFIWFCGGLALALLHFVYGSELGLELFRRSGGFKDVGESWTAIGGVQWSCTPVVWLPAAMAFFFAYQLDFSFFAGLGVLLLFSGSGASAYFSTRAVRAAFLERRSVKNLALSTCWTLFSWFGWLPVPFEATLTYWHTIKY